MTLRYALTAIRHRADLIHLNNGLESQLPGYYAAKILGVPCVVHIRTSPNFSRRSQLAAGGVDRFIAISHSVKDQLINNGVPETRISVVHNAVDIDKYSHNTETNYVRQELGIPPQAQMFGFLGRMIGWKGVKEFVAAAIRVLEHHKDTYALIVGDESDGDPSYFREVRELAETSTVAERIVFTGFRDDIPSVLQSLDLLVHTSIDPEPFGLVLVEAMAAGIPVVAAARGGPNDIVVDGDTGLLVNPEDTTAVAQAIEKLLHNPQLGRNMGKKGQERATTYFNIERYAGEVNDIYQTLLK